MGSSGARKSNMRESGGSDHFRALLLGVEVANSISASPESGSSNTKPNGEGGAYLLPSPC